MYTCQLDPRCINLPLDWELREKMKKSLQNLLGEKVERLGGGGGGGGGGSPPPPHWIYRTLAAHGVNVVYKWLAS